MNCLLCNTKECKVSGKDCNDRHDEIVAEYREAPLRSLYKSADELVAGGRAGTLSRLDEIIEFSRLQGYRRIGLAYCYSMEDWAGEVRKILKDAGFSVSSIRCTVNGVREEEVVPGLKDSVNCNPIGQAEAVNESDADLVIEMGLCLGHDIIFHQYVRKPLTVLFVKDRKFGHVPQRALKSLSG